jgi:hypothetical protein
MLRDTKELVGMTDKAPTCTFKRLPARLTRWQVGNSLAFENYKLGGAATRCAIFRRLPISVLLGGCAVRGLPINSSNNRGLLLQQK